MEMMERESAQQHWDAVWLKEEDVSSLSAKNKKPKLNILKQIRVIGINKKIDDVTKWRLRSGMTNTDVMEMLWEIHYCI